jgi:hypothetical protein
MAALRGGPIVAVHANASGGAAAIQRTLDADGYGNQRSPHSSQQGTIATFWKFIRASLRSRRDSLAVFRLVVSLLGATRLRRPEWAATWVYKPDRGSVVVPGRFG